MRLKIKQSTKLQDTVKPSNQTKSNQNQKFSVIIPVFNLHTPNNRKYLLRSIKSVLNQSYKNFEILIIIDDDNNYDFILQKFSKFKNKIKIFSSNGYGRGPSIARNIGIDNATGDYIAILDGDDFFQKHKLSECAKVLSQKNKNGDFAHNIVITDMFYNKEYNDSHKNVFLNERQLSNKSKNKYGIVFGFSKSTTMSLSDLYRYPWPLFTVYRFNEFKQLRFASNVKFCEDALFNFLMIILNKNCVFVINKPLHYYWLRNGSISHSENSRFLANEGYEAIAQYLLEYKNSKLSKENLNTLLTFFAEKQLSNKNRLN